MRRGDLSARARRNADWIEQHLRVPEGRLVGRPVKLSPEQLRWLEEIYGSPTRRMILSFPRKNAKTTTAAFLVLLHLCGPEALPNSQLYSAARSRDQASVLFDLALKMIRLSPDLDHYLTVRDTVKEIVCTELGSEYKALSADAKTKYGLSPALVVHDELGQVVGPRDELYDALETACAAQESPLTVIISTQAPSDGDLLSMLIDDAMTGADPESKCILYAVPEDADPFDMDVLSCAQPNWHLMNQAEVRRMADEAKRMKSKEAAFRNLIANQRVAADALLVSRSAWVACGGAVPDYAGEPCWVGLDLSARSDLTAMVQVWQADDVWCARPFVWAPEQGLYERARRDRAAYDVWARDGSIFLTRGASIDYDDIARFCADECGDWDIQRVAFDRWRIDVFRASLERVGLDHWIERLHPHGQGYRDMTPAIDAFEAVLLNGSLRHGMHPALTAAAASAIAEADHTGGRRLTKSRATGRIDALVALVMAIGVAAGAQEAGQIHDGEVYFV